MTDHDLYVIKWRDATTKESQRVEVIEHAQSTDHMAVRNTTGFLIREDKDGVVLANTLDEDGECEIFTIPKKMIIKRTKYEPYKCPNKVQRVRKANKKRKRS